MFVSRLINTHTPPGGGDVPDLTDTSGGSFLTLTTEAKVIKIVEKANSIVKEIVREDVSVCNPGEPILDDVGDIGPEQRFGKCSAAAWTVCLEAAHADAKFATLNGRAQIGVADLTSLVKQNDKQAFRHHFSVIVVDEKKFLVCLTVCQFIDSEGEIGSRVMAQDPYFGRTTREVTGRNVKEYPVLETLLRRGFVELTPENLLQYVQALTLDQSSDFHALIGAAVNQKLIDEKFEVEPSLAGYLVQVYGLDRKKAQVG